jgi:hypothetical protein
MNWLNNLWFGLPALALLFLVCFVIAMWLEDFLPYRREDLTPKQKIAALTLVKLAALGIMVGILSVAALAGELFGLI